MHFTHHRRHDTTRKKKHFRRPHHTPTSRSVFSLSKHRLLHPLYPPTMEPPDSKLCVGNKKAGLIAAGLVVVILVVSISVPLASRGNGPTTASGTRGFTLIEDLSESPSLSPIAFPTESPSPVPSMMPTDAPIRAPPGTENAIETGFGSGTRCCPDNYTGFRPYDECNMFFRCVAGEVEGPTRRCPAGALFSVENQNCSSEDMTCAVDSCSQKETLTDSSTDLDAEEPVPDIMQCCPDFFTGYRPFAGCSSYYRCVGGRVEGRIRRCPGGSLFDEVTQLCKSEGMENCQVDLCDSS